MSTNPFPSAADLANDTLATKPHSTLHGEMGEYLNQGFGYFDPTGYDPGSGAKPTYFDPANSAWDDGTWWAFSRVDAPGSLQFSIYQGAGAEGYGQTAIGITETTSSRSGFFAARSEADDDVTVVQLDMDTSINPDGSQKYGAFAIYSDAPAEAFAVELTDTHSQLRMMAVAGQTDPLLDLQNDSAFSIFTVLPQVSAGDIIGTTTNFVSSLNTAYVQVKATDTGTTQHSSVDVGGDLGRIYAQVDEVDGTNVTATAISGQTNPVLDLQDSDGNSVHAVSVNGGITRAVSGNVRNEILFGSDAGTSDEAFEILGLDGSSNIRLQIQAEENSGSYNMFFAVKDSMSVDLANISLNDASGIHLGSLGSYMDIGASGIQTGAGVSLGFYGQTPVAQQTGVSVDAAGIHAALVNLGLITA